MEIPDETPPVDVHAGREELFKSLFEFFKHLTTLSAGSILLMATLLEKLFKQPKQAWLVSFSVGGFLFSLATTMFAYLMFVTHYPRPGMKPPTEVEWRVMATLLFLGAMTFLIAIGTLGIFFIVNWGL